MAVGEFVPTKFLWLLDMVEVVGTARNIAGDDFDVVPDSNYQHLISYMRGNNPLPWQGLGSPGALHCETYVPGPGAVNREVSWPIPGKPEQPFEVILPDGSSRELADGDHVRVVGRWVIDHHPEYCITPTGFVPPEPSRCRDRGWLRVGICHVELHPLLWNDIRLVSPPGPRDRSSVLLSLAAPLHEEQYLGGWKWFMNELALVSGKVFYTDDLSNFHETVAASITVPAPDVPSSWSDVWKEMHYEEVVITEGLGPNAVRSITATTTGIEVHASITAVRRRPDQLASVLDPGRGYSVFQARYNVWWKFIGARISCINKPVRNDPATHIHSVGGLLPDGTPWKLTLGEAIALVKQGHKFYVEQPVGDRVDVVVERSRWGNEYLKTVADFDEPNNLLALPECPMN